MLAKSIAKSIGCEFKRIQFTPDMLPSDVTGVRIYDQSTRQFVYQPGPIQANIVLADEINRATPKTQAALLEAMEETAGHHRRRDAQARRAVPGDGHAEPDRV